MHRLHYCRVELFSPLPSGEQCLKKQCCKLYYIQISCLPERKSGSAWLPTGSLTLSKINASACLYHQCVEHKFLHFWIPKAKQEAKLILHNPSRMTQAPFPLAWWRWSLWSWEQKFASCARAGCWNIWDILFTKYFFVMYFIDCINQTHFKEFSNY